LLLLCICRLHTELHSYSPLPPPLQDIDLRVELNTASSQPENLLKGADVRHVIKPMLNALIKSKQGEQAVIKTKRIEVDHKLDQLILVCKNLEDEINKMEKKVMVPMSKRTTSERQVSFPFRTCTHNLTLTHCCCNVYVGCTQSSVSIPLFCHHCKTSTSEWSLTQRHHNQKTYSKVQMSAT